MLGNLNDFFISINWFHYTHKKMFDVYLPILHMHQTVEHKESRKVCCQVLGFHRLITPNTPHTYTHTTMLDAHPTIFCFRVLGLFPSFVFVVELRIFIDWSHPNIPYTHHDARRAPDDFLFPNFGFSYIDHIPIFHTHTHTYTTMPDTRPTIFCFWVSRRPFFSGTIFPGFEKCILKYCQREYTHINYWNELLKILS